MSSEPSRPSAVPVWIASALAVLGVLVAFGVGGTMQSAQLAIAVLIVALLAVAWWLLIRHLRDRRRHARAVGQQRANAVLAEERLAIARDVHDLVTTTTGAITVRASIGRRLGRDRPKEMSDALADIEHLARSASDELRHVVGRLRLDRAQASPGLAELPEVAEWVRRHDVACNLVVDVARPLSAGIQLAIHRIVSEAAGNALRHATPSRVEVKVRQHPEEVVVEVRNDGRGQPTAPVVFGHGLTGIRERATTYGGTMDADGDGGHFTLTVRMPVSKDDRG